jgi:hypothetical protein
MIPDEDWISDVTWFCALKAEGVSSLPQHQENLNATSTRQRLQFILRSICLP